MRIWLIASGEMTHVTTVRYLQDQGAVAEVFESLEGLTARFGERTEARGKPDIIVLGDDSADFVQLTMLSEAIGYTTAAKMVFVVASTQSKK